MIYSQLRGPGGSLSEGLLGEFRAEGRLYNAKRVTGANEGFLEREIHRSECGGGEGGSEREG